MALSKLITSNFTFETISFCSLISLSKFEHGFLSGFVSSLGGSYSPNVNGVVNTAMSATLGGTAEVIGGGKFSNGAVTGAFVYLLNHALHLTPDPPVNPIATEIPPAVTASIAIISEAGQGIMKQSQAITKALSVETEVLETGLDFSKELGIIGKYGRFLKWAGYVGSAISFADTEYQYQKEIITRTQANIEQASNFIGLIPVVGAAWSAGWWFGKNYGFSTW